MKKLNCIIWFEREAVGPDQYFKKPEKWKSVCYKPKDNIHHQLDGYEFEQTLGVVMDREAWHAAFHGVTESHTTERLN